MVAKKDGTKDGGRAPNGRYLKGQNGGAHGVPGRGRPPIAFKAECERITLAEVPRLEAYLAKHTPDDAGYRWAWDRMAEYGLGKPAQVVTHQGNPDAPLEVSVEHRQALARGIDRLAARFAAQGLAEGTERN